METVRTEESGAGEMVGVLPDDAGFDWQLAARVTGTVASHVLGYSVRAITAAAFLAGRWFIPRQAVPHEGVPAPEASWTLAGKVLLDEIGYATEVLTIGLKAATDRDRIAAEARAAEWLYRREGWIENPAAYHPSPAPLEAPDERRRGLFAGRSFVHLEFDSGYEPHPGEPGRERWLANEPNRRAHAWMLRHDGPPRPWVVCVPGYRMGSPLLDIVGFRALHLHEDFGLNVLIPVLPLHGPRATGIRGGDGFFECDYLETVHALAQSVWDVRRLIGWLRREGAASIGVYGLSLGSYVASLVASLEDDLSCVIAGIPPADLTRLFRWHMPPIGALLAESAGLEWETVARVMRVVSPLAVTPRVPRQRRFIFSGTSDQLVPPNEARDLWRHWEEPRLHWYEGGHLAFLLDSGVRGFVDDAFRESGLARSLWLEMSDRGNEASLPQQ